MALLLVQVPGFGVEVEPQSVDAQDLSYASRFDIQLDYFTCGTADSEADYQPWPAWRAAQRRSRPAEPSRPGGNACCKA